MLAALRTLSTHEPLSCELCSSRFSSPPALAERLKMEVSKNTAPKLKIIKATNEIFFKDFNDMIFSFSAYFYFVFFLSFNTYIIPFCFDKSKQNTLFYDKNFSVVFLFLIFYFLVFFAKNNNYFKFFHDFL